MSTDNIKKFNMIYHSYCTLNNTISINISRLDKTFTDFFLGLGIFFKNSIFFNQINVPSLRIKMSTHLEISINWVSQSVNVFLGTMLSRVLGLGPSLTASGCLHCMSHPVGAGTTEMA